MAVKKDSTVGVGDIELLEAPDLPMTADAILKDFTHYFGRMLGRRTIRANSPFLYQALHDLVWVYKGFFQDNGTAEKKGHQNLIKAVVERERKGIQDDVIFHVFQILGNASGCRDNVIMG